MNRTIKALVVGLALTCASTTGCSTASKSAATRGIASADSQAATRAAVLAAYTGMWSDYQKDLLTANWQNPVSVNHATGEALRDLESALTLDRHHGWIWKGAPVLEPRVKSLPSADNPTAAEVIDCADLSHFRTYMAATGALQDSTPGGRHSVDADLVFEDGRWKVSTLATGWVGSC